MAKLAKVQLTAPFEAGSDEPMLKGALLIAGAGRKRDVAGVEVKVPDIELDDEPSARRVWVRIPNRAPRFIPYERLVFGESAPELAPVAQMKKADRR